MKRFRLFKPPEWAGVAIAAVAVIGAAVSIGLADAGDKSASKKLTGQELYAINCSRCHTERYATERTPGQWKTIVLHMRTRAQIPADQAKLILKYLQDEAGK